jgi:hypothetical protein
MGVTPGGVRVGGRIDIGIERQRLDAGWQP